MSEAKYLAEAENYNWRSDLSKSRYVDVEYTEKGRKIWFLGIVENIFEVDLSVQIRYDGWEDSYTTVWIGCDVGAAY